MTVEVQIHLAKYVPDARRNEPRNFGLCVLAGTGEFNFKFRPDPPEGGSLDEYNGLVNQWTEALEKYGSKALSWVGKRRGTYYIEPAHGEMVQGFEFEKLYEELVL